MNLREAVFAALVVASGCESAPRCEATVDPVHRTSVKVEWTSRTPATAWVEYGVDGEYDRSTPVSSGETEHAFTLLGLGPLQDVTYRAITEIAGEARTCEGEVATENVPSDLPKLDVTIWDPDRASPATYLVGGFLGQAAGLIVFDREGTPVWNEPASTGRMFLDVQPIPGTARLAHNVFDEDQEEDVGELREIDLLSGEITSAWRTENAHHMFVQIPDGYAYTAIDQRYWPDPELSAQVPVVGDAVLELSREGETQVVSSTWDWLAVEKNSRWDDGFYPDGFDWTHANALKYQPAADTYLLSLGNPNRIVEIDRATGLPTRSFGEGGDWPVADGSILWDHPHDPSFTEAGTLLVFATDGGAEGKSGAVEYRLDEASHQLVEVWRSGFDDRAMALGQARRLDNGNTLVSFGANGVVREIAPNGDVVWEAMTSSGSWCGQVQLVNDLYQGR